jgi:hypothetical protein
MVGLNKSGSGCEYETLALELPLLPSADPTALCGACASIYKHRATVAQRGQNVMKDESVQEKKKD